ncbi:MAG: TetR/AcrR family transcriptional regulator [Acidimicrobiales bacterium]
MALAGTSEGRREVKKSETRQAARGGARPLPGAHGVADARVADIAADCGVSERTFFRYFPTKEHAALDGLETWLQQLISAFEELPDSYGPIAAPTRCSPRRAPDASPSGPTRCARPSPTSPSPRCRPPLPASSRRSGCAPSPTSHDARAPTSTTRTPGCWAPC